MSSSMLSGERRLASARRSGMTVLGKVAVPKPINLPSQRLENHGLDPNVEIVPKGTLSWGSKSSSSSNAWGSSMLSPNADCGSSLPSHLSARSSSGGSGTRPSTAGSDGAHEPANVWGSNSRPSSASGALGSNQTSLASLRPRSAETRPGSSQLSRFAEAVPENSGAWSASGTAEKLGITSSKNDAFSLTSGDFPTLGSEKDTSGKNAELQEHGSQGRPGSSSGVAPMKERTETSIVDLKSGNSNSRRRDNTPYSEDGVRPSMEKWHADPQGPHPYPNTGIPPQHYDAWHGPPMNNHPGGVWYRGPPAGPPYGPPVAPGGFPLEPFPYYRPQIPGSALANPQPVPPPGAGPRGPHPKNGDMYRGPMPDAFARPSMPIRPAFYPGPVPVAYEGYYGPPMGYCNSNERDIPFMGMPVGPSAHNRYPGQNALDPGGSHARPSGYGPPGKALVAEHLESGHPHDIRGPYKVLLKQHDGWEGKDEEHKSDDNATASVEKKSDQKRTSWENDWKADQRKEEEVNIRTVVEEASTQIIDHHEGDSILGKVKSSEGVENAKVYGNIAAKKMDHPEVPAAAKDSSLIQKIEGLNAKARASDRRYESISVCSREEQENKSQVVEAKAKHFANEVATGSRAVFPDRAPASGMTGPTSNEVGVSAGDKSLGLPAVAGAGINRRSTHIMHGRTDHRGRGRFNSQDIDGWQKKPPFTDWSNVNSTTHSENPFDANVQDYMSLEASEKSGSYPQARDEGESMPPLHDPSNSQAQRAMMRELAKERVKQRQKEEEERARDQKAKALAKLEELNRRTQTAEGITQKLEAVPDSAVQNKQEESRTLAEETTLFSRSEVISLISNPSVVSDAGQSSTGEFEKPTVLSNQQPLVSTKNVHKMTADTHNHSLLLQQKVNNADAALHNHPQVSDGSTSKQKSVGYKKKDCNSLDKSSSEKYIPASTTELPNIHADAAVDVAPSVEAVINEISSISETITTQNVVNEPSMNQKRKNNRSGKNKHKVEEASSTGPLPSGISKETNLITSVEGSKPKSSECELDPSPFQSLTDLKDGNRSSEQDSASPNEEAYGRVNNQRKSQHSQRTRNPQTHRSAVHGGEAVIWAPVRSHNKAEVTEEISHKSVVDAVAPQAKNDAEVQNNPRNKRAEMERYIPKPVAKEMAQQVISQQPVAPSDNQTAADEIVERADSGSYGVECSKPEGTAMGKVGNTTESRNDGRQSRQGRGHQSWRQRSSAEATLQGLQDGHYSNPSKNVKKSTEQNQHQKLDLSLVKEQPKYDEWNTSDGWNIPDNPDSAVKPLVPVVSDQRMTDRGKRRHAFKGHKGGGNNYDFDPKKINNGEADKLNPQSSVPEMVLSDSPAAPKENRGVGDQSTSHWQPKSSAINQRGSRPDSDQNVGAEIGRTNKKDSAQGRVSHPSQPDKESSEGMTQPLKDQYISEKRSVEEAHNVGYHDSKRERKVASLKGRSHSPNQGPGLPVQAPPSHVDTRNEQRLTAGFHKNVNQNNRFGRGHEFRGDWGSSGQEMKQHNPSANRERHRHNSHFEYQPVGPQNNSRENNPEGPKDGSHGTGARFRERGQSHSRRGEGKFHGRQSGTVRLDGVYD